MKKYFLLIPIFFVACSTDNKSFNIGLDEQSNSDKMQISCMEFVANKKDVPMEDVATSYGYGTQNIYYIPIQIDSKSETNHIKETGVCVLYKGIAKSYSSSS